MAPGEKQLAALDGAAPARRVMISRMVLDNFKSYAGPVTIGPFDSNMTSVVGPNGSGKSNVIDAMLFVFGFRAKQMRQGNVSELIHSSDQHPSLAYTRVSVHFRDVVDLEDGSVQAVEGSELVVAREARRDNSSTYWLDGKKSSRAEVTALLKERGIDLDHNRFLILQGEVEQIAMMKPKAPSAHEDGLLEYLEDIIGSNKLKEPISEAQVQVEALNESRASRLNSLKAVEQQMQALEPRKAEAEVYLKTEAELHERRSALYQLNGSQCNAVVAEAKSKVEALGEQLRDEKEKAAQSAGELAELEKAFKKGKREHERVVSQLDSARKQLQQYEREDVLKREEKGHLKAQIKKTAAAADKDSRKLAALEDEVAGLRADVPRLESESEAAAQAMAAAEAELEAMYDGIRGKTEPLRAQIEEVQREREPLAQAMTAAVSEEQLARGEAQMLTDKTAAASAAVEAAEANLRAHDEAVARSQSEHDAEASAAVARQEALAQIEARLRELDAEEARLTNERRAAAMRLEEGSAARSGASSREVQLRELMRAKRSGAIPGLIGRLGSLGSIDPAYDVAISTACGGLDFMVVADTAAAQQCVELLREKKLGVATFIVLDKQAHLAPRTAPIDTPNGSTRLFDLLRCDVPEHKLAFYFALQDTLVCDDRARASAIAIGGAKRWRVVTTDGVVINPSGTMEGGGKPMRGRMGGGATDSLSEADVAELKRQVEALGARLEEVRAARTTAQAEVRDQQKEVKRANTAHQKLSLQLQAAAAQRAALADRLAGARTRGALSGAETRRLAELTDALGELGGRVAAQQRLVDAADARLGALQEKVLAVGGTRLRAQKSKVETLAESLAGLGQALTKASVGLEGKASACDKLVASIGRQKAAAAAMAEQVEQADAALKKLEDDAFQVHEAYRACEEQCGAKEEALKAMRADYEGFKATVAKVRVLEVDLSTQIEDYRRSIKEHTHKAQQWQQKLSALREAAAQSVQLLPPAEDADAPAGAPLLPALSEEELDALDAVAVQAEIDELNKELQGMSPNLSVLGEYRTRETEWRGRLAEFDAVTEERDATRRTYEELRKRRLSEFMAGFKIIGLRLKEMYQMITLGGDAELELVDSLDPFSEGIVFSVRPPKKSWKNIANLSGGEKTLSSLALVFALHHYKPTPLYVMDEIDAALDFRNVSIVGNYIKERTRNAQFIIISLRNNMFELADRLVGIYKTNDCTKSVTINPTAFTIAGRA